MTPLSFLWRWILRLRRSLAAVRCLDGSVGCGVGSAAWGHTRAQKSIQSSETSGLRTTRTTSSVTIVDTLSCSHGRREMRCRFGMMATSRLVHGKVYPGKKAWRPANGNPLVKLSISVMKPREVSRGWSLVRQANWWNVAGCKSSAEREVNQPLSSANHAPVVARRQVKRWQAAGAGSGY